MGQAAKVGAIGCGTVFVLGAGLFVCGTVASRAKGTADASPSVATEAPRAAPPPVAPVPALTGKAIVEAKAREHCGGKRVRDVELGDTGRGAHIDVDQGIVITERLGAKAAVLDFLRCARALVVDEKVLDGLGFGVAGSVVDVYGKETEARLYEFHIDRAIAEKIDWKNFRPENFPRVAPIPPKIHPAARKGWLEFLADP
jgi:hypothetical protein